MKIVKLTASNIKKLIAVEIVPTENLVRITGKNASGKTSILDSIYWALSGVANIQEQPIRKGQEKASVTLDLGDIVVRRTFNASEQANGPATTALTIENKDGLRFKSPQTMLDGLLGRLSFDPLEFMRQDSRKQFETLRTLTGVDTSKLDAMRQKAYDERTEVNRDVNRLNVQVEAFKVPAGAPTAEVSASGIVEKIRAAGELVKEKDKFKAQGQALLEEIGVLEKEIQTKKTQIEAAENFIAQAREAIRAKGENVEAITTAIADARTKSDAILVPDIQALQVELGEVEEKNKAARAYLAREELREKVKVAKAMADGLTAGIEEIDQQRNEMIAAAKFPLEGLGFGDGAVSYSGLPLSQASSAEQLRVSMAMAMALNPKLKVIRITDGSLLDSDSMRIVEEMANGGDFQVWVEVVDESGKVGVVIEDGQVKAVN